MTESALSSGGVPGDVVERLRAALDAEEATARASRAVGLAAYRLDAGAITAVDVNAEALGRVLRTVRAHRKIIDEHAILRLTYWPMPMCAICGDPGAPAIDDPMGSDAPWTPNQAYPCNTVRALVSIYFPEDTPNEH